MHQITNTRLFLGLCFILLFSAGCSSAPKIMRGIPTPTAVIEKTQVIVPTNTPETTVSEITPTIDVFAYEIVDENGAQFDLAAYKGTPMMLIFFSVHCGHCHHEAENLESLYSTYQDQVNIIALEVSGASNEEVQAFAETYGLTFPVTSDFTQALTHAMNVTGVPTNLLIGSNGALFDTLRGYREQEEFISSIDLMLQNEGG